MPCEQFENELPLLALDELDAERKAAAEAHVAICPECRAKLADMAAAFGLLTEAVRRLPAPTLSAEHREALAKAVARPSAKPLSMGSILLRIAAAVLICAIIAGMLLPALAPAREKARRSSWTGNVSETSAPSARNAPGIIAGAELRTSIVSNPNQNSKAIESHGGDYAGYFPA
jgi:anti-sigma factor RsiW